MKTLILGLVGSGKSTLYRQLNEDRVESAVELELPQSCIHDEDLKANLFHLYMTNPNIDVVIVHPYYLPQNWIEYSDKFKLIVLDISEKERRKRIRKRSKQLKIKYNIFPEQFLVEEKQYLEKILRDLDDRYKIYKQ